MIEAKGLLMLAAGASLALSAQAAKRKRAAKPNFVIILADDLGWGDVGCYGQRLIETPNIDRMAREGMRFTQAYSGSPVSAPSRASLMTGQHSGHTLVRGNREHWKNHPTMLYGDNVEYSVAGQEPYAAGHTLLPEVMKRNGYATGMFGKWAGGYEGSASTPDKRGVDEYFGYICQYQAHLYYPNFLNRHSKSAGDTGTVRVVLEENIRHPMFGPGYRDRTQYSADLIHQAGMEWLGRQSADKPFCGIFTYTLPHAELWGPQDSLVARYKRRFFEDKTWGGDEGSRYNASENVHAQFAAMVSRLDAYVGQILAKLEQMGLADNTLVIFTSDNGPHREGGADPAFFNSGGGMRGIKRECFEGGIREPFVAWWPGRVAGGTESGHMLSFQDVMPTLCELMGDRGFPAKYLNRETPDDCFDGISFAPTLLGSDTQPKHDHLYWEFHETDQIGVREGDWKLVTVRGVAHLFNLADDVGEKHDVAAQYPDRVERMVDIIYEEHRPNDLFPITLPDKTKRPRQ